MSAGSTSVDSEVGALIRSARQRAGWTQSELTARLHESGWTIDASTLVRIERGESPVRVRNLVIVAQALNVSLASLLPVDTGEAIAESSYVLGFRAGVRAAAKAAAAVRS